MHQLGLGERNLYSLYSNSTCAVLHLIHQLREFEHVYAK